MVSPPAPWVTSAMPTSAIVSAAPIAFSSVTPPRQKPVADRHFTGETQRLGAGTDLLNIEEADLAWLAEMNIEPTAPGRDCEDTVEPPFGS
jgi:hypothetical protein